MKIVRYKHEKQLSVLDKIITYKEVICKKGGEEYEIKGIFT